MPLMQFHLIEGRSPEQLQQLLDTAHDAMVEAFGVPYRDRYQTVAQHKQGELILQDTGLGYERSNDVVLLSVVSRPRSQEQKLKLYQLMSEKLHEQCGLAKDDLMISLVENSDSDWSFGQGKAEFITGDL